MRHSIHVNTEWYNVSTKMSRFTLYIFVTELILTITICFDYLWFSFYKGGFKGPILERFHVIKKKKNYAIIIPLSQRKRTITSIISSAIFQSNTKRP